MQSSIIQIGNSQGIRIPKVLLKESGIENDIDIKVTRNGLIIKPLRKQTPVMTDTVSLSEAALSREWNTPEEDKAWQSL